jgi:hypothetical protein
MAWSGKAAASRWGMLPRASKGVYSTPGVFVPISLPHDCLVPLPELFSHASTLHGQAHVSRVMVHAFRLLEATGWWEEAPRLWAAVYLHDIARTHDGVCHRHGADAMAKLKGVPELRDLFASGGVVDSDYAPIRTAVVHHALPRELDSGHPHWRLTSLLKDADALDRVRLGDLDPRYLRNPQAQEMIAFAQMLFERTDDVLPTGAGYFAALWRKALSLEALLRSRSANGQLCD